MLEVLEVDVVAKQHWEIQQFLVLRDSRETVTGLYKAWLPVKELNLSLVYILPKEI